MFYEELYPELGKLFYYIAATDGKVQPSEKKLLQQLIQSNWKPLEGSTDNPLGKGIVLGLVAGKPLGILLFSRLAYKMGIASLPVNVKWTHILGVGLLGGVGFTMALFIAGLAFKQTDLIDNTKISILFASVIAGLSGYFVLRKTLPAKQ